MIAAEIIVIQSINAETAAVKQKAARSEADLFQQPIAGMGMNLVRFAHNRDVGILE